MYVPNEAHDEPQDFGEVHVGFTPSEGIQTVHHVKEIPIELGINNSLRRSQNRFVLSFHDKTIILIHSNLLMFIFRMSS